MLALCSSSSVAAHSVFCFFLFVLVCFVFLCYCLEPLREMMARFRSNQSCLNTVVASSPDRSKAFHLLQFGVCWSVIAALPLCLLPLCRCFKHPSPPPAPASQMVYSTDRSKAGAPVLVLLFVALCFILRGDLLYVLPCLLFLCFSVLLALRLPRLGKRELILVLFVRLFDLCLFGFVGFFFLLVSGKDCGL